MLAEHPSVLQELTAEREAILRNRKDPNCPLTWDEYKQMTFTLHVIYETLRLGTVAPGLLRRSIKDVEYKGYAIPAGWPVMLVTAARHLDQKYMRIHSCLIHGARRTLTLTPYLRISHFLVEELDNAPELNTAKHSWPLSCISWSPNISEFFLYR